MPTPDVAGRSGAGARVHGSDARGAPVTVLVDGRPVRAYAGESIGAALLAAGVPGLRKTRIDGRPRGMFCCMGVCYECLVTVDSTETVRACMTEVADGMRITTEASPHAP